MRAQLRIALVLPWWSFLGCGTATETAPPKAAPAPAVSEAPVAVTPPPAPAPAAPPALSEEEQKKADEQKKLAQEFADINRWPVNPVGTGDRALVDPCVQRRKVPVPGALLHSIHPTFERLAAPFKRLPLLRGTGLHIAPQRRPHFLKRGLDMLLEAYEIVPDRMQFQQP